MNEGLRVAAGEVVGIVDIDCFLASRGVVDRVTKGFRDLGMEAFHGDLHNVSTGEIDYVERYWRTGPNRPAGSRSWLGPTPYLLIRTGQPTNV